VIRKLLCAVALMAVSVTEAREDRREGHHSRPLHRVPDGRSGGATASVSPHPRPHRRITTMRRRPMLTLERLPLTPVKDGVRPECVRRPQSGAEVPWLARLTSLSPGALADSERRSDSQGAQNGAKSPQDGGRGSSIWEISDKGRNLLRSMRRCRGRPASADLLTGLHYGRALRFGYHPSLPFEGRQPSTREGKP